VLWVFVEGKGFIFWIFDFVWWIPMPDLVIYHSGGFA
jgi:hypothetical protein